jgi:hypothetical protein
MMKKRYIIVLLLLAAGFLFANPFGIYAQKLTHTVQKGDTLWDICEEYYGNPHLWPKLWEMNEFITNPHLIRPGDVITLFEQEPVKEVAEVKEEEKEPPPIEEEPEPEMVGIDLASLTNADAIGFLSTEKIIPWGTLFASGDDNMMLSEGDTAYILFDKTKNIEIGDAFSIGRSSSLLKHPVTGKDLGYIFLVNGKLVVEERLGLARKGIDEFYQKKNVFKTRVVKVYEPIKIDDSVLPYRPFSPCVVPVSLDREIVSNIVAAKAERVLIGPGSIVYIDLGHKDGVKRGNVFDVVEANIVPDPQPETFLLSKDDVIILPDRPVGKIMVLESRTDTSTAIVISAVEPSSPGIYIVGLTWQEVPDFLSSMLDCPAE